MQTQKGIPFPVKVGSQWVGGLNADEITVLFKDAVKQEIAEKQKKGLPVARYDTASKRAYLENTDDSREYV
jgi:hypothetical protein